MTSPLALRAPLVAIAFTLASASPSVGAAAPRKDAPARRDDAALSEAAKTRYKEAFGLYSKKRYAEARAALLQATALERRPAYLLLLALSSLKLKRYVDAARELRAYLAEVDDVPAKVKPLVDDAKAELQEHLAKIRVDAPEGAEVSVDGERIDATEPFEVSAGEHTVDVTYRGQKRSETVDVDAESTAVVAPSFAPKPLVAASEPRARPTGPAPEEAPNTPNWLSPPETVWPGYVAGAIGLGGLACAAIFGGLAANSSHAVDVSNETLKRNGQTPEACTQSTPDPAFASTCSALGRNTTLADEHAGVARASLVIGGAASAIALGWFFFAKKTGSSDHASAAPLVRPWASAEGAGASVGGRF